MKKIFKNKLFTNTLIITISTVFNKGINFFILPVLTYYLTKEDYGYLGLIMSIVTISTVYMGLFPSSFLMVKYSVYGKEQISRYMSNIFIILAFTFFLVFFVLILLQDHLFSDFQDGFFLIAMISLYTLFQVIFNIFNTIIQLEKNAIKYAIFQFIFVVSSISVALLLIIQLHWGWKGKFYAELTVLLLLALYAFYYFVKNEYLVFDLDREKLNELFAYLFPMSFHVVGLFIIGTIDKIFLAKYMNLEAVGIYAVAMTMAVIVNIVYDSVMKAWSPFFYEKINHGQTEDMRFIIKIVLLFNVAVVIFTILYLLLFPYVFSIMIDEKFNDAMLYIPILVIGFGIEGMRKPLVGFLAHANKVKTLGAVTLVTAIINIILNIVLIQEYGIYGAAYAALFSFAFLYLMTLYFVHKYCRISWTFSNLDKHLCNK